MTLGRDGRIDGDQIERRLAAIFDAANRSVFHHEFRRDKRVVWEPDVEFDLRPVSKTQRSAGQAVLPRNRTELVRRGQNELERRRAKFHCPAVNHDA